MTFKWTKSQLKAIGDQSSSLAISAGAGSGKTAVMIERALRLIDEGSALSQLLIITFTEKAAAELKSRFTKKTDEISISSANIGTFHSFASRIIREHAPLLGLDPDFSVIEEHTARILARRAIKEAVLGFLEAHDEDVEMLVEELGFKETLLSLDELIRYRWHADKISHKDDILKEALLRCYRTASEKYNDLKSPNLDFQDLEISAIRLLEDKKIAGIYQRRFKHILVDEFQDVNDAQAYLISLLHSPKQNTLTIVGDARQSIYRFRGANVDAFIEAIAAAGSHVSLAENHRSRPGIISFVNRFGEDKGLKAVREDLGDSVFALPIECPEGTNASKQRELEAAAIAGVIPSLEGSVACLFYSLKSSDVYTNALRAAGIPYVLHGGFGFFEKPEILDIINALKVVCNKTDHVALLGLARSTYIGMDDEELYLTTTKKPEDLYEIVKKHSKGSILQRLEDVSNHLSISEMIESIAGSTASDDVEKLINIAREIESSEHPTLQAFLDHVIAIKESNAKIAGFPQAGENAVLLMTVHQAKGLEFDNVILADTIRQNRNSKRRMAFLRGNESDIAFKLKPVGNPLADAEETEEYKKLHEIDSEKEDAESNRLLYVAMTRAQEKLIIPIHPDLKRGGRWHIRLQEHSADLQTCRPADLPTAFTADLQTCRPADLPTAFTADLQTVFTVSELEAYARCPQEYYLKYVLAVPSQSLIRTESSNLPANVHGDIIHRMIETNAKSEIKDPQTFIKNIKVELGIEKIRPAETEALVEQFKRFKESPYGALKARHELPFLLKVDEQFIKGKIDMLCESTNWEVVDFKTGDVENPKEAAKKYELQIKTYGLALSSTLNNSSGKVTLLFLTEESATPYSFEIDKSSAKDTKQRLKAIITNIGDSKFEIETKPPCRTCPFSSNKTCWKRKI